MSKAEERAMETYPDYHSMDGGYVTQRKKRESFIKGYHQAEKDLSDISWIKEVSGVKEMSRAKEEALKAYPPQSIAANYDTINRRDAFEYGYLKAEKDLELTWEDIETIHEMANKYCKYHSCEPRFFVYSEILKQFKDYKERKQQ